MVSKLFFGKIQQAFSINLRRLSVLILFSLFADLIKCNQLTNLSSIDRNSTQNESIYKEIELEWNNPLLGIFFITVCLVTVFGNCLVLTAVCRERCLQVSTNYYIMSLAVADLIVGLVVMPFNGLKEMTFGFWFFGNLW